MYLYVGIIDGCQIRISKPQWTTTKQEQDKFFNRKHFFAWNCLAVCNHLKKITYLSCRNGGSSHDSVLYNLSRLKINLTESFNNRWLIGDEAQCSILSILSRGAIK